MLTISELIDNIKGSIYKNNKKAITGQILQDSLVDIITTLDETKIDANENYNTLETYNKNVIGAINELSRKTPDILTEQEIKNITTL